jgi:pimeloyl-ACP methyl ester carboxylesterase
VSAYSATTERTPLSWQSLCLIIEIAPAPSCSFTAPGTVDGATCASPICCARGHRVYTPTLTGLGERSHLLSASVDLDTHIADVVNLALWEDLEDFVLCGHSFGGMVVTGAADRIPDRIRSLVYLDAFIPEDGQSLIDISGVPMPDKSVDMPRSAALLGVNEKDRAWVDAKCTPHPNGSRTQKIRLSGAWRGIARKIYLRAPDFPSAAFDRIAEDCAGEPGWQVREMRGVGHDVMIDAPEEVARLLEDALA